MSASTDGTFCSDVEAEPLPGTAKQGDVYVLFEWPGPWSHDVLDGATLGPELSARIKAHLKKFGATLQLIRHPTREGRRIDNHHLYIVHTRIGLTEVKHVAGPEAILDLDLSGPGLNHAMARLSPLVLVCTHGKRDRCCAVKGRPLVSELESLYPFNRGSDVVWESSHLKGHRFAATLMLMPWGYSFGRMNLEATDAMIKDAMRGMYFVPGNRGRGIFSAPAQAAEVAVAAQLAGRGTRISYAQLQVVDETVDGQRASVSLVDAHTGATFDVTLRQSAVSGVISSCGEEPKDGVSWGVEEISTGA
ncbi:sucrase ferredoxin [Corynebacterium liangguodongii]|uniref:Sucrase ferredoxin n=1 Tax=Corynebacterium liangguodongii TaxID=2079535 RepID=A0A2S0WCE3_9CORY|nr:sucrase ferredoxin [Corynebacterium liangguodongii]AWB83439.1 sucrase ferredoxin [Corynebacterium liangguodongii]PWC00471.1 sucrase ferredoxin [Corynebacterium liangguodongii]